MENHWKIILIPFTRPAAENVGVAVVFALDRVRLPGFEQLLRLQRVKVRVSVARLRPSLVGVGVVHRGCVVRQVDAHVHGVVDNRGS